MELTGKCNNDFESWYLQWVFNEKTFFSLNFTSEQIINNWKSLHLSEQWGVYIEFFIHKEGLFLHVESDHFRENVYKAVIRSIWNREYKSITDARSAAIEKANELYNQLKSHE